MIGLIRKEGYQRITLDTIFEKKGGALTTVRLHVLYVLLHFSLYFSTIGVYFSTAWTWGDGGVEVYLISSNSASCWHCIKQL